VIGRATVTNTGPRAGVETVQCYFRDEVASVARPDLQLVGFARVALDVGESANIGFEVSPSKLAFFDQSMSRVCEPGSFRFFVGSSSADLPLHAAIELQGERALYFQRLVRATKVDIAR
jgi:beta-glucosidase